MALQRTAQLAPRILTNKTARERKLVRNTDFSLEGGSFERGTNLRIPGTIVECEDGESSGVSASSSSGSNMDIEERETDSSPQMMSSDVVVFTATEDDYWPGPPHTPTAPPPPAPPPGSTGPDISSRFPLSVSWHPSTLDNASSKSRPPAGDSDRYTGEQYWWCMMEKLAGTF